MPFGTNQSQPSTGHSFGYRATISQSSTHSPESRSILIISSVSYSMWIPSDLTIPVRPPIRSISLASISSVSSPLWRCFFSNCTWYRAGGVSESLIGFVFLFAFLGAKRQCSDHLGVVILGIRSRRTIRPDDVHTDGAIFIRHGCTHPPRIRDRWCRRLRHSLHTGESHRGHRRLRLGFRGGTPLSIAPISGRLLG